MKHLLEIHLLQNFAPSNLNRNDAGSPKDAYFGGHRRARVSSQCFKRAMRDYVFDHQLLPQENLAVRTKRAAEAIQSRLVIKGKSDDEALAKASAALGGIGLKAKDDYKSEYILFLGHQELDKMAELVAEYWDEIEAPLPETDLETQKRKKPKKAKAPKIPNALGKAMKALLDGGKAVDLALFGRMIANYKEGAQDAACQVAHALSVNALEREFDFYTAVDDLKPDDTQGADMMGTIEFSSACFYRYIALDLDLLHQHLAQDLDLTQAGLKAFLKAAIKAKPSGKQNSFAAQNDPEYIAVTLRHGADPRSLANAFEKPVRPQLKLSLTESAVEVFEEKWQKLEKVYGASEADTTYVLNLGKKGQLNELDTLDELLTQVESQVSQALGA